MPRFGKVETWRGSRRFSRFRFAARFCFSIFYHFLFYSYGDVWGGVFLLVLLTMFFVVFWHFLGDFSFSTFLKGL